MCHCIAKGQIKPKADWRAVDSPKKRMNEFEFFALKSKQEQKGFRSMIASSQVLSMVKIGHRKIGT